MDSLDLLAREDEFRKLNKQLEKKTESLMKEIEHTMQKQDIFSEFSSSLTISPAHSTKKHCCDAQKPITQPSPKHRTIQKKKPIKSNTELNNRSECTAFENGTQNCDRNVQGRQEFENGTQNCGQNAQGIIKMENLAQNNGHHCDDNINARIICDCCTDKNRITEDLEFLYAFVSVNVTDNVMPQSFLKNRVTVENVCKFLSSKVKLMQEQINRLQSTIDKKASQCEAHLTQLAELESHKMALLTKTNNMRTSTVEMKAKCMALQNKLEEKERLYKEQRSETDKLTSELKRLKSRNTTIEARCATQEETIDNLKQQIEIAKRTEKELREVSRSLSASHTTAISRLEAQIKTLTARTDKQMALIDNLRRQNVLLSSEGALKALEKEYSEFLNQDF